MTYSFTRALCIGFIALLTLTGCSTYKSLSVDNSDTSAVRLGDTLSITTQNGNVVNMVVKDITATHILGENDISVALTDIRSVTRKQTSALKTTGLVIAGVLVLFSIIAVNEVDNLDLSRPTTSM